VPYTSAPVLSIIPPPGVESEEDITRPDPLVLGLGELSGKRTIIRVSIQTFEDPGAEAIEDPQSDLLVGMRLDLLLKPSVTHRSSSNTVMFHLNCAHNIFWCCSKEACLCH